MPSVLRSNLDGWGGFIASNIRLHVLRDAVESGDPLNWLLTLIDVAEELDDDLSSGPSDTFLANVETELAKRYPEKGYPDHGG